VNDQDEHQSLRGSEETGKDKSQNENCIEHEQHINTAKRSASQGDK